MAQKPFIYDLDMIRKRAREHMLEGAITADYKGDREQVIKVLNDALATEIVCTLRYRYHYYMASGIHSRAIADEFLQHANEEQQHADQIAERIVQLDGNPNFSPDGILSRSHSQYVEGEDIVHMLEEDLIAERIAIASYREIIQWLGADDPTTRRVMERILEVEEEHAEELKTMLEDLGEIGEPARPAEIEPIKKPNDQQRQQQQQKQAQAQPPRH
jgi:bacterioferritin